LKLTNNLLN